MRGLVACRALDEISPSDAAHALSHPEDFFGPALDVTGLSERDETLDPGFAVDLAPAGDEAEEAETLDAVYDDMAGFTREFLAR